MIDLNDLTIVSGATDRGSWESVIAPVPSCLRPFVLRATGYRELNAFPALRLQPPMAGIPLIVKFGGGLTVSGNGYAYDDVTSFVAGLDVVPAHTISVGDQFGIQLDFTPVGAVRLLNMPLSEIVHQVALLPDLLGREAHILRERIGEADTWIERLQIAMRFVHARISSNPGPPDFAVHVLGKLFNAAPAGRLEALAESAGVSRRYLTRQFKLWFGMTPALYNRIARFDRAIDYMRRRQGDVNMAWIAAELGYSDQPHFNRDFKAFSGVTPSRFAGMFLEDGGIAAT